MKKRLKDEKYKQAVDSIAELDKKMTAIEEALYQTKNSSNQDPLNFPIRLNDKLASVTSSASTGDFAPSAQAKAVKQELIAAIDAELSKLCGYMGNGSACAEHNAARISKRPAIMVEK